MAEPTKPNEKDEETADKDNTQRIHSAVPTETKGEVTLDSKTGKNIQRSVSPYVVNKHFVCSTLRWKI